MNEPTGLILAAGRGERLRPGVDGLPKPLVELNGITLLARQARELRGAGAAHIVAIVNSETGRLISERMIALPSELTLVVRDTANSMETLLAAADYVGRDRFFAATVDAVLGDGEFKKFAAEAALAVTANSSPFFEGALGLVPWRGDREPLFAQVNPDGRITELGTTRSNFVTAGVYYLSSRIFDFGDPARRAGVRALREFLGLLPGKGFSLKGVLIDRAIDIDEPADLAAARNMV